MRVKVPSPIHRAARVAALALLTAGLAACNTTGEFLERAAAQAPVEPAPHPVYSAGQTYVFDDDGLTVAETVVQASPSKVIWANDKGATWSSYSNPFLMPNDFSAHSGALKIERKHSKAASEIFPLMIGKRFSYSVSERIAGMDETETDTNKCEVTSRVNVYVRAGTFDTYEVHCLRNNSSHETFYYSPQARHNVLTISGEPFKKIIKELVLYEPKPGEAPAPNTEKTPASPGKPIARVEEPAVSSPSPLAKTPAKTNVSLAGAIQSPILSWSKKELVQRAKVRLEPIKAGPVKASITQAGYGVQMGAFQSVSGAQAAWRKLVQTSPRQLGALKPRYVDYTPTDGRPKFTRLVIGAYDRFKSAQRMCDRLKRHGLECWSVGLE